MNNIYNLGIRGRFFFAFGVLSALTLVATIVSWISYNRLENELNSVVEGNIQTLSLISDLKEGGTKITLMAPTLLAAEDEQSRQQLLQKLNTNIEHMIELIPRLASVTPNNESQTSILV